jgi:hypothetical protein
MRKQTVAGISIILAIGIVYLLRDLAGAQGLKVPYVGFVSPLIASFVVAPILIVSLTLINQRVLSWRKAYGRDIEEEERYENEAAGIISLRPKSTEHENDETIEFR